MGPSEEAGEALLLLMAEVGPWVEAGEWLRTLVAEEVLSVEAAYSQSILHEPCLH